MLMIHRSLLQYSPKRHILCSLLLKNSGCSFPYSFFLLLAEPIQTLPTSTKKHLNKKQVAIKTHTSCLSRKQKMKGFIPQGKVAANKTSSFHKATKLFLLSEMLQKQSKPSKAIILANTPIFNPSNWGLQMKRLMNSNSQM